MGPFWHVGDAWSRFLTCTVFRFTSVGSRIMEKFAERYHEENPGVFSCAETVWVLSFGLMILNTDMYNRNIKVKLMLYCNDLLIITINIVV